MYLVDVDGTAVRSLPEHADLTDLDERYGALRAARGDDNRAGLRLADRLARSGLELLEFRGRYFIGQLPLWRGPTADQADAYNRSNSPATQEATVPDNDAVTGADALRALRQRWREQYAAGKEREADFTTLSGEEVAPLYDPLDHPDRDVAAQIGVPGQYPFTRGVYPSMYRGRPWTIRQFSGFGNARETNERYKYLIGQGGGGLSVAFDMPTLMGRDSDDPRSLGEVG
ncbi:MAG TPA: methylmalonyl-CoA mutase family protein, partial [Actinomycetota bacterium]|nr:methylmalonyl-CoA mutase family protein [Actinomycetota bacterium]